MLLFKDILKMFEEYVEAEAWEITNAQGVPQAKMRPWRPECLRLTPAFSSRRHNGMIMARVLFWYGELSAKYVCL